jgi:hypothetical protein
MYRNSTLAAALLTVSVLSFAPNSASAQSVATPGSNTPTNSGAGSSMGGFASPDSPVGQMEKHLDDINKAAEKLNPKKAPPPPPPPPPPTRGVLDGIWHWIDVNVLGGVEDEAQAQKEHNAAVDKLVQERRKAKEEEKKLEQQKAQSAPAPQQKVETPKTTEAKPVEPPKAPEAKTPEAKTPEAKAPEVKTLEVPKTVEAKPAELQTPKVADVKPADIEPKATEKKTIEAPAPKTVGVRPAKVEAPTIKTPVRVETAKAPNVVKPNVNVAARMTISTVVRAPTISIAVPTIRR